MGHVLDIFEHSNEPFDFIQDEEFLDRLSYW
jgi:hypothetical protein